MGEALTGLEPGARVIGVGIGCGAFAEYTALPAAAVMPVPAGWAAEQALGLVVNWPTALAALRPLGRIAAGQTVLIHAAAVIIYGVAGGEAPITNWELVYKHQVHVIGLNIGVLIQAAPQIFGEVMGDLFALIAAGVLTPGQPTAYELADGPKALAELETRATVGKLALLP